MGALSAKSEHELYVPALVDKFAERKFWENNHQRIGMFLCKGEGIPRTLGDKFGGLSRLRLRAVERGHGVERRMIG